MPDVAGSLHANVLLRLLLNDVPDEHDAARDLVRQGVFKVSDTAVAEVVFVLGRHYGLERPQVHHAMMGLLRQPWLAGSRSAAAALDQFRSSPKLSFEDCLLVEHARSERAEPLWTFDRKLVSQTDARAVPREVTERGQT